MRRAKSITTVLLIMGLVVPAGAWAQGKGRGPDKKNEQAQPAAQKGPRVQQNERGPKREKAQAQRPAQRAQGRKVQDRTPRDSRSSSQGMSGRERASSRGAIRTADFKRAVNTKNLRPEVRRLVRSNHAPRRLAAGALSHAYARGVDDDALVILPMDDRVLIRNRSGDLLIDLDDNRARNLGYWNVTPTRYVVQSAAPSFCRSGAGHPRWGRQWCLDKGFGLGSYRDLYWGRSRDIGDIIFGRRIVDRETLLRDALIATVGNIVFDRLGLHALTLGYTQPLSGVWVTEPASPQVLLIHSGSEPVAEIVDLDHDNRADMMVFALRPW